MSTLLNRAAYQKLVDEDVEWLLQQPRTLERDHIEVVLRDSVNRIYVPTPPPQSERLIKENCDHCGASLAFSHECMGSLKDRIATLERELQEHKERPMRFLVTGGPVVMSTDFDAMKQRAEKAERELAYASEQLSTDPLLYPPTYKYKMWLDDARAELSEAKERERGQQAKIERLREALTMLYEKWENGDPCFENPDEHEGSLGNAFKLSYEEENQVIALLVKPTTDAIKSAAMQASAPQEEK